MSKLLSAGLTFLVLFGALVQMSLGADRVALKNEDDEISYSVGYQMGTDFKKQKLEIQPEAFLQGIQDALSDSDPLLTSDEMGRILVELKERVVAVQREERMARAKENLQKGQAFLEKNARKKDVVTLPSGLQYRILEDGGGASPGPMSTVTVHYRGTLVDGTEFDSSYRRGQPATFKANRVIKGWSEALQLMREGSKWELFIPPDLAYGMRGAGTAIEPNSTLIFEVTLLSVKKE